jgi:fatty acid desaturase
MYLFIDLFIYMIYLFIDLFIYLYVFIYWFIYLFYLDTTCTYIYIHVFVKCSELTHPKNARPKMLNRVQPGNLLSGDGLWWCVEFTNNGGGINQP